MRMKHFLLTLLALLFVVPGTVRGATITGPAFMAFTSPGQPTLRVNQIGNTVVLKGSGGTTITTDRTGKSVTFSSPLAPAGKDGATWYSGAVVPATGLGKEGDFYFRTDTASVYKKVSGLWGVSIASLKGNPGTNGVGVPPGGLQGQILGKASGTNYDTVWVNAPTGGSSGGTSGVTTVFGRPGAVWAQVGDYDTSQVPDTFNKRYVTDAQRTLLGNTSGVNTGNETTASIGNLISGATVKAVPTDSDSFGISDYSAANAMKKLTWSNIKIMLKSYFDAFYHNITVRWTEIADKPTFGTAAGKDVGTTAGTVAAGDDSRLANSRTPTAHAATHAQGGSDPLTLSTAQITGLDTALAGKQGALPNAATLAKVTESAGLPLWNGSAWPGGNQGGGDMYKAVYDPQGKNADTFARANHTGNMSADNVVDGTANKAYTAAEKSKLAAITGSNTGDETTASIKTKLGAATSSGDGYLTAADHAAFAAKQNALVAGVDYMTPSGSITGNAGTATKLQTARNINGVPFDGTQAITIYDSTKVPTTTTVNGKYLSASIALDKTDVGLANVDNTADLAKPVSTATQAALDAKISANSPTITGTANFTGTITATGITGPLAGNASTATKLQTARNINGVPFDGSAPITVNAVDATARVAQTQTINGVAYGSGNITINAVDATPRVPQTTTVNGHALSGNVAVTATDVGLGSVDNTADLAKPVSTAQQAALDLKASKDNPIFTTGVTSPNYNTNSPDGTHVLNVRNTVARTYTPQEGDLDTDSAGRIWIYATVNGTLQWVEKGASYTPTFATSNAAGIVQPGTTLTISNGVVDVSPTYAAGLATVELTGDQAITPGSAYLATGTGMWTFTTATSTKQTTLDARVQGTACAASGSLVYWSNPITGTAYSGQCVTVPAGTKAAFQMVGGKTYASVDKNLQIASVPGASVSPTSLAFGSVGTGSTSTLTATLTNSGLANLVTGTPSIPTVTGSDKFAITANGCNNVTLAPGATCTESITFTPGATAGGPYSAQLSIPHNASGSPTVVALTGTGVPSDPYTYYFASDWAGTGVQDTSNAAGGNYTGWTTSTGSLSSVSGGAYTITKSAATADNYLAKTGLTGYRQVQAKFDVTPTAVTGIGGHALIYILKSASYNGWYLQMNASSGSYNGWVVKYNNGSNSLVSSSNYAYSFAAGHTYTVRLVASYSTTTTSADGSYTLYVKDNGGAETQVASATGLNTYEASGTQIRFGEMSGNSNTNTWAFDNFTQGHL